MKYLLDTDHLSILQRQSGAECTRLVARLAQVAPADVVLCVVSFHEQILGGHTYVSRARTTPDVVYGYQIIGRIIQDFTQATVLPFDAAAGVLFDTLSAQRVRLATMDLRIAAIALSNNLVLLTRNRRDFGRVPGLQVDDWTA